MDGTECKTMENIHKNKGKVQINWDKKKIRLSVKN